MVPLVFKTSLEVVRSPEGVRLPPFSAKHEINRLRGTCGTPNISRFSLIGKLSVFWLSLVCSYVAVNPGSDSTLVLFPASIVLCVVIVAVAPGWRIYLSDHYTDPSQRICRPDRQKSLTPEFQLTALIAW